MKKSSSKRIVRKPELKFNILKPLTQNQEIFIQTVHDNILTFCTGPAGTGKSHVSIGIAVKYFNEGHVNKIIITRPMVQCGPNQGYLPGTIENKMGPYLKPIMKSLKYFLGIERMEQLIAGGDIEISPIEMMRGDDYQGAFVVLDEMQNCDYDQLLMLSTRLGNNSKMIFGGDLLQTDVHHGGAIRFYKELSQVTTEGEIGFCKLTMDDIVRGGIVRTILTLTQKDDKNRI